MHFMSPAGNGSRFRNRISPAVLELEEWLMNLCIQWLRYSSTDILPKS